MSPISLKAVVTEAELVSTDVHGFLCIKTGEVVLLGDDEIQLATAGDSVDASGPDWYAEAVALAREITSCDDFVRLPFEDRDDHAIMRSFVPNVADDRHRDELAAALAGRRAFRRFREAVRRAGLEPAWHAHRRAALAAELRAWLESRDIPFVDDLEAPAGAA